MKRIFILCLLFVPGSAIPQPRAFVEHFYSRNLQSTVSYSILLPSSYTPKRLYPILYLLHGYGGDHTNWSSLTDLPAFAAQFDLIIIMPDGANSWYVNAVGKPEDRYEEFMMTDLLNHVERRFSVDSTARCIAGLSMGGYGAITLALRSPGRFCFAGSLSGALSIPSGLDFPEHFRPERSLANLHAVFGPPGPFRDAHDPFLLFRKAAAGSLPYLYLAIGTSDGFRSFLPATRALADSLRSYGARYEYHETPGGHQWKYWEKEIRPLIRRMMEVVTEKNPAR